MYCNMDKKKSKPKSTAPNPIRQNYDYSTEMGGPEWQNRVKTLRDKGLISSRDSASKRGIK